MQSEVLKIENSKGFKLNARLELPEGSTVNAIAIFAHCFTCSSNLNAVRHISKSLTAEGVGVLRFDFTGLGRSEGSFAESHFGANVSDLIDVHNYMKENYTTPSLIIGHSLGGTAAIVAASKIPDIKAVVTIGSPASAIHTKKYFSHRLDELETKGEIEVNLGGRPFIINKEFIANFENIDLLQITKTLNKPLLIMHAPSDNIVDIENAQDLFIQAQHPKSFVSLDNADHLLTQEKDSKYVGHVISSWSQRYIG